MKIATGALALTVSGCNIQPEEFSQLSIASTAQNLRKDVTANQTPVTQSIDLYEAMARALKYNLDYRVELMNEALSYDRLDLRTYALLPKVVINTGYTGRNNLSGGRSKSINTGRESLEASTSSDKDVLSSDLSLSYNVLDFGLNYIRAKQAADDTLIARERKRQIINEVIEDVRATYWRAVSADRLSGSLSSLDKRVGRALNNSKALYKSGLTSPVSALTYQRELLDIRRQIQDLHQDLKVAKAELAKLMNLAPNTKFKLVVPKRSNETIKLKISLDDMITVALQNRPEIIELQYQGRSNQREAKAALLELLPGFEPFVSGNVNSNSFLQNANWVQWGSRASWNLLKVFAYPAKAREIKTRNEVIQTQALATTMAIMTQLHVSKISFEHLHRKYKTAAEYMAIQNRILSQITIAEKQDAASEQSVIREQMNSLVASIRHDIIHADLQNTYGTLFRSMGLDPYGTNITGDESIPELAKALRNTWQGRDQMTLNSLI